MKTIKKWKKPELTVLVRRALAETVLAVCKGWRFRPGAGPNRKYDGNCYELRGINDTCYACSVNRAGS